MSGCPITSLNGKPCTNAPHQGSIHDICPEHWAEIIEDHKRNQEGPEHLLVTVFCPICRYELRTGPGQHVECSNPTCWEDRWWEQPNPAAEVPAKQGTHWVYYIRFGNRIKIGTSSNVRSRLNSLPFDEILALERGNVSVERERHRQFAAHLIAGQREWFEDHAEIRAHAAAIRQEHGDPHQLLGVTR